jgi:general stress protein YciG
MSNEQSSRGGSHEQHVKAGQQSHKNSDSQTAQGRTEDAENSGEGRGWHGDPEGHAEAGRKGGEAVSQDREHMAEIGRKGGEAVSQDREHMAEIGREGGEARGGASGGNSGSGGGNSGSSRSGNSGSGKESSSQSSGRGGTHEQHVAAGEQSHKNK